MTKPIIVVKICYKLLYVIQVDKRFLISNFLASTDIKGFGRTCNSCNMGMRGLPDMYAQSPRAAGPRAEGIHIR